MRISLISILLATSAMANGTEAQIREALSAGHGEVHLPAGVITISSALELAGAHDLDIVGDGTTLRAADEFSGRALLVFISAKKIRLHDFKIDGNRPHLQKPVEIAPYDKPFSHFYGYNGVLVEDSEDITFSRVHFEQVANFPILISHSTKVLIDSVEIGDSGSKNARGRNNTSGGILIEEGSSDFEVRDGRFRNILGNGVWTHSLYTSPRNRNGRILRNRFTTIGRDAIQIGHATNIRVERNSGFRIGYPFEAVDVENGGTPVAIDTAGNVDRSVYAHNRFEEVNGKFIDLDGFHDGEVISNSCRNRKSADQYPHGHYGIVLNNSNPDMRSENIIIAGNVLDGMKFGGIFLIGSAHKVLRNRLLHINLARCNESAAQYGCLALPLEPALLQSGIYLGRKAEFADPSRHILIKHNQISGYKMKSRCVGAAPGVSLSENTIAGNLCRDENERIRR